MFPEKQAMQPAILFFAGLSKSSPLLSSSRANLQHCGNIPQLIGIMKMPSLNFQAAGRDCPYFIN